MVWFVIFPWLPVGYVEKIVVAEAFAVLVEAAWLRVALKRPRALGGSLLANGLSFGLGMLSRYLFGWP